MNALQNRTALRTGSIAPMLAISVVALFTMVALAIDMGMLIVARTQCQNSADAAALAGTRLLNNKPTANDNDRLPAETEARTQATSNRFLNQQFVNGDITALQTGLFRYDTTIQRFYPDFQAAKGTGESWTAMRVTVQGQQNAYFSKVFGLTNLNTGATAVAVHRPRDVAFSLDFTGSMKFGTTFSWSSGSEAGFLSPDPSYPQFSHYERFLEYGTDPNLSGGAASPSSRPNPLRAMQPFVMSSGELLAVNNLTVETPSGPPCVKDFYFDPTNLANPAVPVLTVNYNNLQMAFHRWNPSITSPGNSSTYTAPTYSFAGYNAFDTTGTSGPIPAPDNFKDQSDSPITYVGDRFPRKRGQEFTVSTNWDAAVSTGAARNLAEYLGWLGAGYPNGYTTNTTPAVNPPSRTAMSPNTTAYATNWSNFRDATWETYGYDMDVADYIARRGSGHDPRNVLPSNTTGGVNGQVKVTSGKFKGYSMGPGYWGKTFFMWPPDPRANWDWRQRFFYNRSGAALTTQGDNDTSTTGTQNINQEVLRNGTGRTVNSASGNYTINYNAILAWLKSGPQVLPPNLRAGRVVYYTSIPNDVNTATGTAEQILDKVFWREYIEFVIGSDYTGTDQLAGNENRGWPEGTTPGIGATAGYVRSSPSGTDPLPYMNYLDNPSRPRMHFWFGPLTMMAFICEAKANWWAGTVHEAQCWQLKVAINSVLDDIKNNNPNDFCGLAFFSHSSAYYKTIRSPMSQDYVTAKNALFYPFNLVPSIPTSTSAEIRPYDNSFNSIGSLVNANIPNANGGTDPNSGFALAYNLLSSAPSLNANVNKRGRRGASKVVIFETDGVPNSYQNWSMNYAGYESYYTQSGNGAYVANGDSGVMSQAYTIVDQIRKPVASTNAASTDSGYSMPNSPARVYAIGFGDLFSTPSATQQANARAFLLEVQKRGGTSASTDAALPPDQIITGDYQTRIDNLRGALERIMQSGVQVTLIE